MKVKEVIEWVEELDYNPYPENIFLPIPQEQYDKIHELLKKEMGMPIDRLMGHIGRKLRKNIFYNINKGDIISLLQQGEAYRQMWEELKIKGESCHYIEHIQGLSCSNWERVDVVMDKFEQKYLKEAKDESRS